jgi:hypothetical protein
MVPYMSAESLVNTAKYFDRLPNITEQAARIAINQVATRGGLKLLREEVQDQAAFPAGYLKSGDRLYVSKKAQNKDLEAVITARFRPTSLARFVRGALYDPGSPQTGLTVQVKPGTSNFLPKAFLVKLRAGASLTADNYNLGLAIRLKPGTQLRNKNAQSAVQLSHNLYLLYGPSVDQIFRTVSVEQSDAVADLAEEEFFRQLTRLSGDEA